MGQKENKNILQQSRFRDVETDRMLVDLLGPVTNRAPFPVKPITFQPSPVTITSLEIY